jgi:uncharacterized Zn finger protein
MKQNQILQQLVSRSTLRELAGDKAFHLGERYLTEGAVRRLNAGADRIDAHVDGATTYRVILFEGSGKLKYDCSCPRAGGGYFCKHCVAVGLAWLQGFEEAGPRPGKEKTEPWNEISDYLTRQDTNTLAALVIDAARRDPHLYRELLLKAARAGGGADLTKTLRQSIDDATTVEGFVAWNEAEEIWQDLEQAIDGIADSLAPETSGELVELIEHAIERVENMLENIDDSDGGAAENVLRLGALHFEACRMANPDPRTLAERLFRLETTLPCGIYSFDPIVYGEVLGQAGLYRYRELALAEWRAMEAGSSSAFSDADRHSVTRIMESFAKASGDVDQLVEIKSRDLSSSHRYFEIATLWREAGDAVKALEWAELGLAAFPANRSYWLLDLLVELYLDAGRSGEALKLVWTQFAERPSLDTYRKLAAAAGLIGCWAAQRERALKVIDAAAVPHTVGGRGLEGDFSLRVEVALWEQDLEAGWEFVNRGRCDRRVLLALADQLAPAHPDDALSLYRRLVAVLLDESSNRAYEQALGLVQKMAAALDHHRRLPELATYLDFLRVEFKRKRNFIKLIERFAADGAPRESRDA